MPHKHKENTTIQNTETYGKID